ncbi:MAG: GNAT family N-acetyltransferase [Asticcacaulis sp.]
MSLAVEIIPYDSPAYAEAVILRRAVLRTPLGLDFTPEQLAAEATDTHFAAYYNGAIAGAVVMTPYDAQTVKLRQMAVSPGAQGRGIGAALLDAFEAHARRQGMKRITLAARLTARGFYERHGYVAQGDVFNEVTLPHIAMSKAL